MSVSLPDLMNMMFMMMFMMMTMIIVSHMMRYMAVALPTPRPTYYGGGATV